MKNRPSWQRWGYVLAQLVSITIGSLPAWPVTSHLKVYQMQTMNTKFQKEQANIKTIEVRSSLLPFKDIVQPCFTPTRAHTHTQLALRGWGSTVKRFRFHCSLRSPSSSHYPFIRWVVERSCYCPQECTTACVSGVNPRVLFLPSQPSQRTDLLSTCPRPGTSRSGRPGRTSSSSWWSHIHWTQGSCIQCYLVVSKDNNSFFNNHGGVFKNSVFLPRSQTYRMTNTLNFVLVKVCGFTSKWLWLQLALVCTSAPTQQPLGGNIRGSRMCMLSSCTLSCHAQSETGSVWCVRHQMSQFNPPASNPICPLNPAAAARLYRNLTATHLAQRSSPKICFKAPFQRLSGESKAKSQPCCLNTAGLTAYQLYANTP